MQDTTRASRPDRPISHDRTTSVEPVPSTQDGDIDTSRTA
jgi:hypothetical protein